MKVRIYRQNPEEGGEPFFQDYEVPVTTEDRYTVMDVLEYIYYNLDSSLAFYSHSVCNHGICGRCGVKINGKPGLACTHRVTEPELTLEPINSRVVRDLVTR